MFRLSTENDLLEAFRPRDRRQVELPKGRGFPLTSLDYFAWREDPGERLYLVFKAPGDQHVTGITFRFDKSATVKSVGARTCHWCNAYGSSEEIGLVTADVNSKRRIGLYLCLDLGCGARLEDDANRRGKSARDAVNGLLMKMRRFAEEGLGILQDNRNQPSL